jgi:hypothetical protein
VIHQSSARLYGQWVVLVAALAAAPALAQDAQLKWGPHIDLEAKPGTKRSLGEADLFIPMAQSADTLLFASLRLRMDDNDSNEGNYGLGVRHMLDSGWNIGGYGYFDRRRTEFDNHFNQVTLGVEALSQDWDLRANYYAPVGRRTHLVDALSTAEVSGTTVVFRGGEERSLGGFDAEIGWRVPLFDANADRQFRLYGGGYRFTEDSVPTIQGPRARAELTFDSVPYLWEGSRFSIGAEWQHDDPRGSQGFLTARLRIPLQVYGKPASRLTPMERRMADPVVRDIDVVSQAGQFSAPETANQLASGGSFTVLNSSSTAGDDLDAAVTAAGNNSTVILAGSFQTTGTNAVSLAFNQTLTGVATVRSASGRLATLSTGASINGTNMSSPSTVQLNAGGNLTGLTVTSTFSGGAAGRAVLVADGSTGVVIADNIIRTTQSGAAVGIGLGIGQNTSVTVRNNTLTATGSGAATIMTAFFANSTNTTLTFAGNTVSATGGTTNNAINLGAGVTTISSGSTGNINGGGACTGTSAGGSISFTNGTTCP